MKNITKNMFGFAHHALLGLVVVAIVVATGVRVLQGTHALESSASPSELERADSTHIYYAMGATPPPANVHTHKALPSTSNSSNFAARQYPASVDLTKWAPPVKNQGNVGSCVAWAVDYNLFGWYVKKYHHVGGMHSPMYSYAQEWQRGASFPDNLWIGLTQGVPAVTDVKYPYFNYHHEPTAKERQKAAIYKIKSYFNIFTGTQYGNTAELLLKYQLANRGPAVIAIPVYKEFDNADSSNSLVDLPAPSNDPLLGWHAVAAFGYNSKGLIIENSWGKKWGDKGFGTLSWDFVNQYAGEASAINGIIVNKSL